MTERTRPADHDVYDLPFDPGTMDVVCKRYSDADTPGHHMPQELHFNITRQHVHHSPSGWEWGYGGSGPSDLALNILALFIGPPPNPGPEPELVEDGSVSDDVMRDQWTAWDAWQDRNEERVQLYDKTYVHRAVWELHNEFKAEFVARLPHEGGTIPGTAIREWIATHTQATQDDDSNVPLAAGHGSGF